MIFESPHAGRWIHIREPQMYTDPGSGFREIVRPALEVDFFDASVGGSYQDADGNTFHDIRGGAFDTDEAAARLGWTEEEKKYVEAALLSQARNPKSDITLWEPPKPECPLDETVYAEMHPSRVIAIASETKQLDEYLAWERHAQNRPEVVAALEKKIAARAEAATAEAALTAS